MSVALGGTSRELLTRNGCSRCTADRCFWRKRTRYFCQQSGSEAIILNGMSGFWVFAVKNTRIYRRHGFEILVSMKESLFSLQIFFSSVRRDLDGLVFSVLRYLLRTASIFSLKLPLFIKTETSVLSASTSSNFDRLSSSTTSGKSGFVLGISASLQITLEPVARNSCRRGSGILEATWRTAAS